MNGMHGALVHAEGSAKAKKSSDAVRRSKTRKKRVVITMKEAIRSGEIGKVMYVRTGPTVSRICIEKALAPDEIYDYVCEMLDEMDRAAAKRR